MFYCCIVTRSFSQNMMQGCSTLGLLITPLIRIFLSWVTDHYLSTCNYAPCVLHISWWRSQISSSGGGCRNHLSSTTICSIGILWRWSLLGINSQLILNHLFYILRNRKVKQGRGHYFYMIMSISIIFYHRYTWSILAQVKFFLYFAICDT
jgi:hypothetical protein